MTKIHESNLSKCINSMRKDNKKENLHQVFMFDEYKLYNSLLTLATIHKLIDFV